MGARNGTGSGAGAADSGLERKLGGSLCTKMHRLLRFILFRVEGCRIGARFWVMPGFGKES